jgi:4-aminobutyrate aminotransferase-like enzyme
VDRSDERSDVPRPRRRRRDLQSRPQPPRRNRGGAPPDRARDPSGRRLRSRADVRARRTAGRHRTAGIDRFLFATTGSEANEAALRPARTATRRPAWCAIAGASTGARRAPSSPRHRRRPSGWGSARAAPTWLRSHVPTSSGCPPRTPPPTRSPSSISSHRHQLAPEEAACYVIEPVQGHGGCHPAGEPFLRGLRERADPHGVLLVF